MYSHLARKFSISKELSGDTLLILFNISRFSGKHHITAFITCLRTKINDPIGTANNIQVMLDNDDRMSLLDQCIKRSQQFFYIVKMKTCCWLIKNEKYLVGIDRSSFSKKRSQLYTLRFTPPIMCLMIDPILYNPGPHHSKVEWLLRSQVLQ